MEVFREGRSAFFRKGERRFFDLDESVLFDCGYIAYRSDHSRTSLQ